MDLGKDEKKQWLSEVKEAAKEGAKEGAKENRYISGMRIPVFMPIMSMIIVLIIVLVTILIIGKRMKGLEEQFSTETSIDEHDMALEDNGILGYTVADFAEVVLGDKSKLCKLQVLQQEVSDAVTITDTGLGKLKAFTKTQIITYHGTAIYTVDLSQLTKNDFDLNNEKRTLTIYVPRPVLEPINIQSRDIEFGDVSKGVLAFGDMDITPEQMAQVQTTAQDKMKQKIEQLDIIDNANRFAKMVVWEMYQPVINSVCKGYSLEVEFR